MASGDQRSFGVFKPVDHVVISFPTAQQADAAAQAHEWPSAAQRRCGD